MNDKELLALNYLAFCDHTLTAWLNAESPEAKAFAIERLTLGACAVIGSMYNQSGLEAQKINPNDVIALARELVPNGVGTSELFH